jgi:hypothetical protein
MVIVLVAAGIRVVVWLLAPLWRLLLAVALTWAVWHVRTWWLDRW